MMPTQTLIGLLTIIGGLIAVWVQLNGRITRLEVEIEHTTRQFGQIMDHLRRIEEKLDGKQDRV